MKKSIYIVLSLTTAVFIFSIIRSNTIRSSEPSSNLILTIATDKETYILGERINLQFEIKDKNDKAFTLVGLPTVEVGYMRVWIAAADGSFKEYKGAGWGFSDSSKPWTGKSFKSQAEILFNGKPPESWKNESYGKDRIYTDYAFMESGVYLIKATATISPEGIKSDDERVEIESEPIQIVVNHPVDDDLAVWNKIKDNGDIGGFMQNGSFPTLKKPEESQKLLEKIEKLISKYPNSLLVKQLKQSREKFLAHQELMKQSLEENKRNSQKKP